MRHTAASPRSRALATLLLAASLFRSEPAASDDSGKRALIFAKALSFERRLLANSGSSVGILVIHAADEPSRNAAQRWLVAFKSLGAITVGGAPVEVMSTLYERHRVLELIRARSIDVLIGCTGVPVQEVGGLAREQGILSAGDTLAAVRERLTLGVFVEGEKPTIVINMRGAELDGAKFSSKLLQLAERI